MAFVTILPFGGSSNKGTGTGGQTSSAKSYDANVDYASEIKKAASSGDYATAAYLEQQRNEKIADMGLSYGQTSDYTNYLPDRTYTSTGQIVTENAQRQLGALSDGQSYSVNHYNGNTTTTKKNADGTVAGTVTLPYEKTKTYYDDGSIRTQETPFSTSIWSPTKKKTTATTKDGNVYTFEGDNWIEFADKNGLDSGSLATAISYPDYVDAREANRFLNEQADRYNVDLNNPIGSGPVYSWQEAVNMIPDYETPFASAAAGQTETNYDINALSRLDQAYLDALGSSINVPLAQSTATRPTVSIGTGNSNINNIVSSLGGKNPSGYEGFDYRRYFDDALSNYEDSVEAQRAATQAQFDAARATTDEEYARAAQQAYIANYIANRLTREQLLESGIRSGLTESSLLQGQANFENAYNQNELQRIAAMRDIDMQNAVSDANYSSQLSQYIGNLLLQEAQMAQSENAAANDYYMNQLAMAIDQANADRQYALQLQQLEYDRAQNEYNKALQELELAYEMGDLERLEALGYDTTLVRARIQDELNGLTPKTYTGGTTYTGGASGSSGGTLKEGTEPTKDGETEIPTLIMPNGTEVIYVNGRAYNAQLVEKWINEGKIYMDEKSGKLHSYAALQ